MKAAVVLLLIPMLATSIVGQQFGGQQQVIITDNLLPVGTAQSVPTVVWYSPVARLPIYCVASTGAQYIRFTCPDCNVTNINNTLRDAAVDMSGSSKFPSYKLSNFPVSSEMNGRVLVCEARFQDSQMGQRTVEARATMSIQYFERPLITDDKGNLPLSSQSNNGQIQGKRFYIQRNGGSKTLRCSVDSNPRASSFSWMINGQQIGTGESYTVGTDKIGNSIQCKARSQSNMYPDGRDSDSVRLDPWDTPSVLSTNFEYLKTRGGVFTQGNKIMLQKSITLQCTVTGNPPPTVMWMQQSGARILNASCTPNTKVITQQQRNNNNNNVNRGSNNFNNVNTNSRNNNRLSNTNTVTYQSDCTIQVKSYSVAGKYWCAACNSVAQNSLFCNPKRTSAPTQNLEMDVIGRPQQSDVSPYVIQNNRQSPAYVYVSYCADPQPAVPRQIFWTIGDQRVNIGERKGNFFPERPQRNSTFFDCYQERLVINPVTSADEKKRYQLTIVNNYGTSQIQVPVQNMLGEQRRSAGNQVGLAVGLTLGFLVLLIIILVAICWWRRLCCFAGGKNSRNEKKYHSNLAPEHHLGSESMGPPPKYDSGPPPPVNGYGSERGTNGYNSGYPRKTQEGLTYAEMDLVREPARISPSQHPPTDYAHVQHSYPLKSPTNSVV